MAFEHLQQAALMRAIADMPLEDRQNNARYAWLQVKKLIGDIQTQHLRN